MSKKISQLTSIENIENLELSDVLAIVNSGTTKKITLETLAEAFSTVNGKSFLPPPTGLKLIDGDYDITAEDAGSIFVIFYQGEEDAPEFPFEITLPENLNASGNGSVGFKFFIFTNVNLRTPVTLHGSPGESTFASFGANFDGTSVSYNVESHKYEIRPIGNETGLGFSAELYLVDFGGFTGPVWMNMNNRAFNQAASIPDLTVNGNTLSLGDDSVTLPTSVITSMPYNIGFGSIAVEEGQVKITPFVYSPGSISSATITTWDSSGTLVSTISNTIDPSANKFTANVGDGVANYDAETWYRMNLEIDSSEVGDMDLKIETNLLFRLNAGKTDFDGLVYVFVNLPNNSSYGLNTYRIEVSENQGVQVDMKTLNYNVTTGVVYETFAAGGEGKTLVINTDTGARSSGESGTLNNSRAFRFVYNELDLNSLTGGAFDSVETVHTDLLFTFSSTTFG
jgi:hypothetical protein